VTENRFDRFLDEEIGVFQEAMNRVPEGRRSRYYRELRQELAAEIRHRADTPEEEEAMAG
jgi:hypothetical protein